jgi:phospholipid/cholesterol/gamma-HCH transport system substrate-binding protein
MELRYKREALVGLILIIGAVSFVFLMMWLKGASFKKSHFVTATFSDVAGLKEGDPVRTSGVRVGAVKAIHLDAPGRVSVTLDVDAQPQSDAKVRILSQDFFGARFIDYWPGQSATPLPASATLAGDRAQDLGEMGEQLGAKARTLMDTTQAIATMVSRELRATLRTTQSLLGTLNHGASTSTEQLTGALEDLRRALQRVDLLVQQNGPVATETMGNMRNATARADSLTRTLQHTSAQFDSILAKVNSGRGPAAALLNDSTVVRDLMGTNAALRDLLTDFRANPGRYIRLRLF